MKLRGSSLIVRVFLLHAVLLGLAGIAVPLGIDMMLRERISYFETRVLEDRVELLRTATQLTPQGTVRLIRDLRDQDEWSGDEFIYAAVDEDGMVLFASAPEDGVLLERAPRRERSSFANIRHGNRHFDTLNRPIAFGDDTVWLAVGWNLAAQEVFFDDIERGFLWRSLALSAPLLALLLLLDILIVRRFFRQVVKVAHDVQEMDPTRTDVRLPAETLPSEVQPLAVAFNGALERVEQSYLLQKEFTADAAHELRTPLAVLEARLQSLPPSEDREALRNDVKRMTRIVSQLLDMAVLDQTRPAHEERTDLIAVSSALLASLGPEAIRKGQDLGLNMPEGVESVFVSVREEDVWHMLRNLIENAIRHTPAGTQIDVVVTADGTLTVHDNGPGIPEDIQPHIFQRFWRRSRSGSGAGLGMAIVQRVVTSSGGTITLRSAEGEGTAFIIQLPVASQVDAQASESDL